MKKYNSIIITTILLNIFYSCDINNVCDDGCSQTIIGEGDLVDHPLNLDAFTKISLIGQANINIVNGETQSVNIRAQENIYEVMDHEVSYGEFKVGVKDSVDVETSEGIFIDIVTPSEISDICIVGAGVLTFDSDKQESFNINITGAGEVNAYNTEIDTCTITITGAGNCQVYVNELLTVNIAGAGNVYFKGHPEVVSNIAGVGNIVDEN